jgi:mannan endo-1,4-beta-mannosidase
VLDKAGVDAYAATKRHQAEIYVRSGLKAGKHAIKIVVTGKKNASSSGAAIDVDAFKCIQPR